MTASLALPFTRDQVRRGIVEYEGLIDYVESRRRAEPMAAILQLPKLPNKLTECFVGELIGDGTLLGHLAARSVTADQGADLVVDGSRGRSSVEVKGTAQSFTMFSQKDLDADFLVWVDFGVDFRRTRRIGIHTVQQLGRIGIGRDTKMTLPEFLKRTTGIVDSSTYDWAEF